MSDTTIDSPEDINEGLGYLAKVDPKMKEAIVCVGTIPLRRRGGGFPSLLEMIASQQLSVAAANSIIRKLEQRGFTESENVVEATDEQLRSCGLSLPKVRYIRELARRNLDYEDLHKQSEQVVIERLTSLSGIGTWTAEIYLMFSMGRRDVIAAGDLALQEATRMLFDLESRPTEKELRALAEKWSPWRGVAARLLWAYYRLVKEREGVR